MSKWDELSIREKAEMMMVAIDNGITNLNDIKSKYNEFAEGGNLYGGDNPNGQRMITTGGAGYIPSQPSFIENLNPALSKEEARLRLYNQVSPVWGFTNDTMSSAMETLLYNKGKWPKEEVIIDDPYVDGVWAEYLQIPENQRRSKYKLKKSDYRPMQGAVDDTYFKIPINKEAQDALVNEGMQIPLGKNKNSTLLEAYNHGEHTIGNNIDPKKGQYVSYFDIWDLNPLTSRYSDWNDKISKVAKFFGLDKDTKDLSFGLGKPLRFYDRVYLDDYYGVDSSAMPGTYYGGYLPEIKVQYNGNNGSTNTMGNYTTFGVPIGREKALGGNLYREGSVIHKPYYDTDGTLHYNVDLPEVTVVPDSKLSPTERNYRERQRQKTFSDYAEQQVNDWTQKQVIKASKPTAKETALGYAADIASGIGMGADIVSRLPIYSSLKGSKVLSTATTPLEYAEGALWLSPMLEGTYQGIKPIFKTASKPVNPNNIFEAIQYNAETPEATGRLLETQQAAEKGRNKLLEWIQSPFYKQRLEEEPFYRFSNDIVNEASTIVKDAPLDFSKTVREIDPSGNIVGTTTTRPALKVRDDGYKVFDLNTGLDVNIGSDLGSEAEDTTLHELLHYLTVNSKGIPESTSTMQIVDKGWMQPLEALYNPVGKNILRGKKWQNYILDQNDALLPKYDSVVDMVMNRPDEAKAALLKAGRTEAQADVAIKSLQDRYAYWTAIQEQRAHLQELFISKIKPHLKNPNDAAEIESFLSQHPEILENSAPYNYIQEVRPGSLKQYAGYFASALSTLPFINKLTTNKQ